MNIFKIFEKKALVEVPDGKGGTETFRISKSKFNKILAEVGARRLITVHISCPVNGYYTDGWELERIGQETYEKFRDKDGDIYASVHYENGEPVTHIMVKQMWDKLEKEMKQISMDTEKALKEWQ